MSIHSFSPSLKDEEIAHYLSKGYYAFRKLFLHKQDFQTQVYY